MSRPRHLELFCGSFGTAEGFRRAGFDVTGVDLVERPRPDGVTFVKADALEYLAAHWQEYDTIGAGPPCHDHSTLSSLSGLDGTGQLLADTLRAFAMLPVPWVVENVASAPMPGALVLCGSEFGLGADCADGVRRTLRRHRRFLSSVWLWGAGGCSCAGKPIIGVYGTGGGGQMTRGYKGNLTESRQALGMPWADRAGVSLAIPPAYGEFIATQMLAHVRPRVGA